MLAVQMHAPGGPQVLEVVTLPDLPVPPGHVAVQAAAIGVGRPDVLIRTGKYKWMPPLPAVLGNELTGTVSETGAGVDAGWVGRPVLVSSRELPTRGGCYATRVVVPAEAIIPLPDGTDLVEAACLPNYQLAWGLLHDATRGRLPRSIYLNGAGGGVGSALVQLCVLLGVEVVAGAGSDEKRAFARTLGAAAVVDTSDEGSLVAQVLDATGGRGVEVAYDHLCGPGLARHLELLAPFGLLVSYNALRGLPQQDVFAALRGHAAHALGIVTYNMHAHDDARERRRALLQQPMEWLAAGRLRPLVRQRLPLAEARRAHEMLDAGSIVGKMVLLPES
ncbi:MAG TPA: zinc-binding dehydrogenase [Ramlibacter sp.]|nr:zinc-binding dehydrogenase [Ramlibacter sp.]